MPDTEASKVKSGEASRTKWVGSFPSLASEPRCPSKRQMHEGAGGVGVLYLPKDAARIADIKGSSNHGGLSIHFEPMMHVMLTYTIMLVLKQPL